MGLLLSYRRFQISADCVEKTFVVACVLARRYYRSVVGNCEVERERNRGDGRFDRRVGEEKVCESGIC